MSSRNLKRWRSEQLRSKEKESSPSIMSYIIDKAKVALAAFLLTLIGSGLTLAFINFGGDKVLRKINFLKTQAETTHEISFEGTFIRLTNNNEEVPIGGATVAVEGNDDHAGITEMDGTFDFKVRLPLGVHEATLRFLDEDNRLIHEEKAHIILNETGVEESIRYVVSNTKSDISI